MTRRAPLTDKEERIMVQAQLMGLTTASMIRVGNRLRALEQEEQMRKEISHRTLGWSWPDVVVPHHLTATAPDGRTITALQTSRSRSSWVYEFNYRITITNAQGVDEFSSKPKDVWLTIEPDWKKRMMPGQCRELYALITWYGRSQ